jgi:hypothetical protein
MDSIGGGLELIALLSIGKVYESGQEIIFAQEECVERRQNGKRRSRVSEGGG